MFRHNFLISYRNLIKNKGYTVLNIGGLSLGMMVTILIGLWIQDELSFDQSFENYDHIAQVARLETVDGERGLNTSTPLPLGPELNATYGSDFQYIVTATQARTYLLSNSSKKFTERGRYMGADAPELFSLKMLNGTRAGLKELKSVLLSASLAERFFAKENPVGKTISIENQMELTVTGVYEDFKQNSTFEEVSFMMPYKLYLANSRYAQNNSNNWDDGFLRTYVQIPAHSSFEKVSARIKDILIPHISAEEASALQPAFFLHPMKNWRLGSTFENGVSIMSERMKYIWFYGIIGAFVLFLACINFMNLSTARSEKRAKEVGIRKSLGSMPLQLIKQFLSESFLVSMVAFILSVLLAFILLPWFNSVADKELSILWSSPLFWILGIAFSGFTALLAGSYPAFYLSALQPVKVLKGTFKTGRSAILSRKALVVTQFTVSIALIIGTIIVFQQIQFAKVRPLGYEQERLVRVFKARELSGKEATWRNELLKTGMISDIAASASRLTRIGSNNNGFTWGDKAPDSDPVFGTLSVSGDFGKTVGWQFVEGRDFSLDLSSDSSGMVINEAAAKLIGFEKPVGETITWNPDFRESENYTILGVIKDMVMRSPFKPAVPTVFYMEPDYFNWYFIKIKPEVNISEALSKMEVIYNKLVPADIFEYTFVSEQHAEKFADEERIGSVAAFFALLAILISCLGLLGLAAFVAEQRTKEIGIRKVLGASVASVWKLLSIDFIKLVFVSCFIAIPIAYYFGNGWLQNYEYRTTLSPWMFIGVGVAALLITVVTVSLQAVKAAMANPVESIKVD